MQMALKNKGGYLIGIILLISVFILFSPVKEITGNAVRNSSNLEVQIPEDYQKIIAGDSLWFTTKIINLANDGRVDVTLEYIIFNEMRNTIATRTETVAIETQASFVGKIDLPEDSPPGDYILEVNMIQANGETSLGKTSFQIRTEDDFQSFFIENKLKIAIVSLILIIGIILIILRVKINKVIERIRIKSEILSIINKRKVS